jgi:hypothetical protein
VDLKEFTLKNGLINNPGKFEGEALSTPYFYGIMLDGEGSKIRITDEDRQLFDNIPLTASWAVVIEDSQGFVTVEFSNSPDDFDDYYYLDNLDDYQEEEF